MLTRFIRNQLIVFAALTLAALVALGWYYLRIPSQLGVGQYRLVAELPASGGLYRTSNVTYRGIQIGRVTKVEPTKHGARATMCTRYRRSVSSTWTWCRRETRESFSRPDRRSPRARCPAKSAPRWTQPTAACRCYPSARSRRCWTKRRRRLADWGPRCNDWSTRRSRSSATFKPTSPTSTTSSRTRPRSWTAKSDRKSVV